jgi:hypothetical protein
MSVVDPKVVHFLQLFYHTACLLCASPLLCTSHRNSVLSSEE